MWLQIGNDTASSALRRIFTFEGEFVDVFEGEFEGEFVGVNNRASFPLVMDVSLVKFSRNGHEGPKPSYFHHIYSLALLFMQSRGLVARHSYYMSEIVKGVMRPLCNGIHTVENDNHRTRSNDKSRNKPRRY